MYTAIRKEIKSTAVDVSAVAKFEAEITSLKTKASSSSSCVHVNRALWFWTTGKLTTDGLLLWDTQAVNTNTGKIRSFLMIC